MHRFAIVVGTLVVGLSVALAAQLTVAFNRTGLADGVVGTYADYSGTDCNIPNVARTYALRPRIDSRTSAPIASMRKKA